VPALSPTEELLTRKELAARLKRDRSYISAMIALGFTMPGGTATLAEAREFLKSHPNPRSRKK